MERQKISSIIEFLRIVDMCAAAGMEAAMADEISSIVMNAPPDFGNVPLSYGSIPLITPRHSRATLFLPSHHPVRQAVGNEAIEEYILSHGNVPLLRTNRGMQPSKARALKNSRLESFLADLVKQGSQVRMRRWR